jgi:hypothetical protein
LVNDVEVAKEAIAKLVQQAQGGRKAHLDHFSYSPEDGSGAIVHHIAVYLETPASFLMEFTDGENYPQPVLHREAREVAIDYDPRSGRLDVAGKGIGGFKIFERLAKAFSKTVLTNTEVISVTRPEWDLVAFIEGVPRGLVPPEGFSSCRVTGLALVSLSNAERRMTIRAGKGEDIYHYMRIIGFRLHELHDQTIQAITITLIAGPRSIDEDPRDVRVTLTWPNARSFESASLRDQTLVEPWLSTPPFLCPK